AQTLACQPNKLTSCEQDLTIKPAAEVTGAPIVCLNAGSPAHNNRGVVAGREGARRSARACRTRSCIRISLIREEDLLLKLAGRHQRAGISLNNFAPGGVGTSKTLSVTETNE